MFGYSVKAKYCTLKKYNKKKDISKDHHKFLRHLIFKREQQNPVIGKIFSFGLKSRWQKYTYREIKMFLEDSRIFHIAETFYLTVSLLIK